MFGKGVLLILLVLGAIAYQAQARPRKYIIVLLHADVSQSFFSVMVTYISVEQQRCMNKS